METELSLTSLLVSMRGLDKYLEHLHSEIKRLSDSDENNEDQIANLNDEVNETNELILYIDEIYHAKYKEENGREAITPRRS